MKKVKNSNLIFIAIGLILILLFINIRHRQMIKKDIDLAQGLFLQGKYNEAIEKYENVQMKIKKNPLYYGKISNIQYIKGNEKKAKEYIKKAKDMNYTKYEQALSQLIYSEFLQGEYKKAIEDGEKGLKLYPKNKDIIKQMIVLYIIDGNSQRSNEVLKSYPLDEKSSEDVALYSKICINIGKYKEGLEKLKLAYKLDKDNMSIYDILSQMAYLDQKGTIEKINSVKKQGEDDGMYKMWLSKVYSIHADTCEEALKLLRGDNIDKNSLSFNTIKLALYSNLGDFYNGDKLVKKLENDFEDDYRIFHSLGWYYLKKGDLNKSREYCKKSIESKSSYMENYGYLMPEIIDSDKNNSELALAYYEEALYKEPFNYSVMMNLGNFYWNVEKDIKKSIKYYNLADKININNSEIKYNKALVYLDNNKDEVVDILNECIKLRPKENKYYRTLSVIYLNKGNYKECIKFLEKAESNDKNDLLTLNNMAIYYIIGKEDVNKGFEIMNKAYIEAKKSKNYDKYSLDILEMNYKKIKDLKNKYKTSQNTSIKVPELTLFY